MTHITDAILQGAVGRMPDVFEAHEVIRELMTNHPQEYVRELYDHVTSDDPIRVTHAVIGRTIERVPGVTRDTRVDSPNVRGPQTENQRWRKLPLGGAGGGGTGAGGPTPGTP